MATLTLSQLRKIIAKYEQDHGDIPFVHRDADTGWYFSLSENNFDPQLMPDGSYRLCIGIINYGDAREDAPVDDSYSY